jgi:energy-coupling factor transport system permease protein
MKIKFHPIVLIALLILAFSVTLAGGIILQSLFVAFFVLVSVFLKKRRVFWKKMATFGIPLTAVLILLNDVILSSLITEQTTHGVYYALRFLVLLTCLLTIIHTTTPAEFALGLRSLRLPPRFNHIFLLSFEVFDSFRTITRNVTVAQQLRGFHIQKNIFYRARNLFPLFFPVIFSALSMSVDRGVAFDLKGINSSNEKTYLSEWKPTTADKFITVFLVITSLLLIVFR